MQPEKTDAFLEWGDYFVAWPLSVPSEYPDWMLVTFETNSHTGQKKLVPVRALSPEEVAHVKRRPITYWGMKVPNSEWALIMWRPGQSTFGLFDTNNHSHDAARAIGV